MDFSITSIIRPSFSKNKMQMTTLNAFSSVFISRLGFLVASHPYKTVSLTIVLTLIFASGCVKFHKEKNPLKLWIPQGKMEKMPDSVHQSLDGRQNLIFFFACIDWIDLLKYSFSIISTFCGRFKISTRHGMVDEIIWRRYAYAECFNYSARCTRATYF